MAAGSRGGVYVEENCWVRAREPRDLSGAGPQLGTAGWAAVEGRLGWTQRPDGALAAGRNRGPREEGVFTREE